MDADLQAAWIGWSAQDWVNHLQRPENFVRDFPSGIAAYKTSAYMHLYPLAVRLLGVSTASLFPAVLAIEVTLLVVATTLLARSVLPKCSPVTVATCVMFMIASCALDLDVGRFTMPHLYGLYYVVAEATRLIAIAFAWRGWLVLSAVALAISTLTHPVMAFMGGIFIAAVLATDLRGLKWSRAIAALLIYLVITGSWFAYTFFGAAAEAHAQTVDPDTWVRFTRAFSYHFYPVEFGVFSSEIGERFLQLVAYLLLAVHYIGERCDPTPAQRRICVGAVALAIATAIGVVISVAAPHPLLVKLALQRSSLVLVLVLLPFVLDGLWRDVASGTCWRATAAAGVLLAPFVTHPGWPLVIVAMLVGPACIAASTRAGTAHHRRVAGLTLLLLLLTLGYVIGPDARNLSTLLLGNHLLAKALLLLVLIRLIGAKLWIDGLVEGSTFVLVAAFAAVYLAGTVLPADQRALYGAYRDTQLWARENTAAASVFMVDPALPDGWRDLSQRSSFGSPREWLHSSWLYDSREAIFREGSRRFAEFGVDPRPYLDVKPSILGSVGIVTAASKRYNEADDGWRRSLAAKYGIGYFVIDRRAWKAVTTLPVVYRNDVFMVLSTR